MLERFSPEFRERHVKVHFSGELVAVDTFLVGTLKSVGRVYLQTVLDCYSRYAWARLYTNKLPITAVQNLNNHVLPFFEEYDCKVQAGPLQTSLRALPATGRHRAQNHQGQTAPEATASSNASTEPSWTSTFESRAERRSTNRPIKCRRTSMTTLITTTWNGRIRDA